MHTPRPKGTVPPKWVIEKLRGTDRQSYILDHGFSDEQLSIKWFQDELNNAGLGQFQVSINPNGAEGSHDRLTRGDLFALASRAESEDDVLNFLWHVLIWGHGKAKKNGRRRIAAFKSDSDRRKNLDLLTRALALVRQGDVKNAYKTLIRRGGAQIPYLGPAFFTKFLYFNSNIETGQIFPILDSRVAESIYRSTGWDMHPAAPRDEPVEFSGNWYIPTYEEYCDLLTEWGTAVSDDIGRYVARDELERALFEGEPRT